MSAFSDAAVAQVAADVTRVYKVGAVPASPTMPYQTVATSFDGAEAYSLHGRHGVGRYRVTTQSVAKTLDGATDLDDLARGRLLDQVITAAGGKEYGPGRMQVGAAVVRDPDGGSVITVTSTYLFATEE